MGVQPAGNAGVVGGEACLVPLGIEMGAGAADPVGVSGGAVPAAAVRLDVPTEEFIAVPDSRIGICFMSP